jgi:hypothetical protein
MCIHPLHFLAFLKIREKVWLKVKYIINGFFLSGISAVFDVNAYPVLLLVCHYHPSKANSHSMMPHQRMMLPQKDLKTIRHSRVHVL